MNKRLFCFGLGYCARALARNVGAGGFAVGGTSRSPRAPSAPRTKVAPDALGDAKFSALRFDRDHPLDWSDARLYYTTHLLISIPPDEVGDPVLDLHVDDIATFPELRWVGYLSTTGVYGDCKGEWVDETTPPAPASDRAVRRYAAEQAWLAFGRQCNIPVHVFRLSGIYGPGRSAFDQLRAGAAKRIDKPGQVFSRIHVDDIAAALAASMARPRDGAIYNLADDFPASPAEVVEHAARLLGMTPPPLMTLAQADLSPMAESFYAENKRVANRLMKQELRVALRYPTYREGLAAILKAEKEIHPEAR
jgi:nucleoside-diphosphate-sugar epimerase